MSCMQAGQRFERPHAEGQGQPHKINNGHDMQQADKQKRIERKLNRPNKFELRRNQLAQSTLATMGKNGYAKTSMRDIASDAGVSLGTLHYYFVDKAELVTYCVQSFKRNFIQRVIERCQASSNMEELLTAFCEECATSMLDEFSVHRVWFDIRAQAMFDPVYVPLREEIELELEAMFQTFIESAERFRGAPISMATKTVGCIIESLFENQLFNYIQHGDGERAKHDLETDFRAYCKQLLQTT
ncbi:MAG: TetR/AcrR family transcriptional regulator [Pseudomonadota bacterium]